MGAYLRFLDCETSHSFGVRNTQQHQVGNHLTCRYVVGTTQNVTIFSRINHSWAHWFSYSIPGISKYCKYCSIVFVAAV